MKKVLIVVDMQYDFIDEALANPAAAAIVPGIAEEIKSGKYSCIIFTRDSHFSNYLNTPEGRHLPVEHCQFGTHGWEIHEDLVNAARSMGNLLDVTFVNKPTFGTLELALCCSATDDITLVGTCTDICVLNNAIILKSLGGEVNVIAHLCAGLTPELHDAALKIMEHNHINIK